VDPTARLDPVNDADREGADAGSDIPDSFRPIDRPETGPLEATWLGRTEYREVWALQRQLAGARARGEIADRLLLVEHPAVLTLGRQADEGHVRATPGELAARGIELIHVERGGEVTWHGPGQLVAYPIVALSRRGLLVRPLVRALEAAMIETCAAFGVAADRRDGHPGCWVVPGHGEPRKIGALGIRVERGVSYHGIALNVDPDLGGFELIDACGMPAVISTSIAREAGRPEEPPSTSTVEQAAGFFARAFSLGIGVELAGFGATRPAQAETRVASGGSDASAALAAVR
jgi:lipoyl(octanoyl) transferase